MLYSLGSQAGAVDINHVFHLYYNVVCGLSFTRSQPDFNGFLRALRFSPSSKLTPSLIPIDNGSFTEGLSWINIRIIIITVQLEVNMREKALIGYSTGAYRLMKFSEGIRELKSDHESECFIDYGMNL